MIQIDMQMPKNCIDCPACNEYLMCAIPCNGRGWGENDVKDFSQSRPEWCPMKEQEAVEPIPAFTETGEELKKYVICGHCKSIKSIMPKATKQKYCYECGHPVLWEMSSSRKKSIVSPMSQARHGTSPIS